MEATENDKQYVIAKGRLDIARKTLTHQQRQAKAQWPDDIDQQGEYCQHYVDSWKNALAIFDEAKRKC